MLSAVPASPLLHVLVLQELSSMRKHISWLSHMLQDSSSLKVNQ
jgi:hypothetical protein